MSSFSDFLRNFDGTRALFLLISVAASLLCITFHELCHGLAAYAMGDTTARDAGRLTLNPLKHIDLVGLLMMLTVRVGWAKPVPVDMRRFRGPRRGMALTALAGPAGNFILAAAALLIASVILSVMEISDGVFYLLLFLMYIAVLSVGLGLFNLIPISPLDGSKVLLSVLPEKAYTTVLRYERIGMLAVVILAWIGVFSGPLTVLMEGALKGLCWLTRFPFSVLQFYFF